MKKLEDTKKLMAFWFQDMAHSIEHSKTAWRDEDEMRNWAVFQFILMNYHKVEDKERFWDNIEQTKRGLCDAIEEGNK